MTLLPRKLACTIAVVFMIMIASGVEAYEVVVDLGSTASPSITAAMTDRSQWPYVADNSWGIVANYVPIASLPHNQQATIFNNFSHHKAIVEIPYHDINWNGSQGHIAYIESFGYSTPYLLILDESNSSSTMTRDKLLAVEAHFPDKTIIMNARSWKKDGGLIRSLEDVLDGVCIEYIPTNAPYNINEHVSPFFEWAVHNNKIIMFLMPPQPNDYIDTRYIDGVQTAVRTIFNYHKNRLPKGWMSSNKILFLPANYTFGESHIHYVPETASNTILATAKALMDMRTELEADGSEDSAGNIVPPLFLLLD